MHKLLFLAILPIFLQSPNTPARDLNKYYTMGEYCSMPYKMRRELHSNVLQPPIVPTDSDCQRWKDQAAKSNVTKKVDPKVYEDFRITAKALSKKERDELKGKIEEKQQAEYNKRNNDAVIYYQVLLNILDDIQKESKGLAKKSAERLSDNISDGKREPKLKEFDEVVPESTQAKTIDR